MKKQLLLVLCMLTASFGVSAQNVLTFDEYLDQEISSEKTIGIFTLVASSDKKMSVDGNTAKFSNGESYTTRLKTTGKTDKGLRTIKVACPSAGTLKIGARTGSNSATDRNLVATFKGNELLNKILLEDDAEIEEYDDNGETKTRKVYSILNVEVSEAGEVELSWPTNHIYFYYLEFDTNGEDPGPVDPNPGDEEITKWSFNSEDYLVDGKESGETISAGEYAIANGMTIIASEDGKVKLEINKSIADGAPSTIATRGALNTGGNRNGFTISDVKTGDRIQFAMAATGEVKEGELRGVDVSENNTDAFEPFRLEVGDPGSYPRDFEYTVKSDGVVKFLSERAVVFYNVILISEGGSEPPVNSIDDTTVEKEIVATEYYSINGIRLAAPVKGINIVKNLMDDGSVETSKFYLR